MLNKKMGLLLVTLVVLSTIGYFMNGITVEQHENASVRIVSERLSAHAANEMNSKPRESTAAKVVANRLHAQK